jgi:hypothetical protein
MSIAYLVLDIEATGEHYLGRDRLICIAYCFGTATELIQSGQLLLPVIPGSATMREYWTEQGFGEIEWQYFWSRKENLERLESWSRAVGPNVCPNERNLFSAFNALLAQLETLGDYVICTDTTCYDTIVLDVGLRKHGYAGLNRTRDGKKWLNSLEVDSLLTGLKQRGLDQLQPPPAERNHALADNDAVDLYARLCAGLAHC